MIFDADLFVDPVTGDEVVVSQKQVDLDTLSRYKDVRVSRVRQILTRIINYKNYESVLDELR